MHRLSNGCRNELSCRWVETYARLSRGLFHAIAAESRRLGTPFAGRVPDFVPVTEPSDAGLAGIEHLFEFWYDTSGDEERLCREIARVGRSSS
jgi:hypothetical protein